MNSESVSVEITTALIARFAKLTGDKSSLHVDDAFARRSAYRRPIAHGMLPVAFLALSEPFHHEGCHCIPVAINGQFLAPVFAGDVLRLSTEPAQRDADNREAQVPFAIANSASGTIVTRGVATVRYEPRPRGLDTARYGSAALIPEPLDINILEFEDIAVGTTDLTPFTITGAAIEEFEHLLAMGTATRNAGDVSAGCHVPNLLALMLFSTSVGIRVPGAAATFLEFNARFERPATIGTSYISVASSRTDRKLRES